MAKIVDKLYYNAESLDRALQELEREYGATTDAVYAAYIAGERVTGLPYFMQHVWVSFHEDVLRLTDGAGVDRGPIMARVGRALACR